MCHGVCHCRDFQFSTFQDEGEKRGDWIAAQSTMALRDKYKTRMADDSVRGNPSNGPVVIN